MTGSGSYFLSQLISVCMLNVTCQWNRTCTDSLTVQLGGGILKKKVTNPDLFVLPCGVCWFVEAAMYAAAMFYCPKFLFTSKFLQPLAAVGCRLQICSLQVLQNFFLSVFGENEQKKNGFQSWFRHFM